MVVRAGSPATISCEPRQARKGAAVTANSGAGVWLVWTATYLRKALDVKREAGIQLVSGSGCRPASPLARQASRLI